MITITDEQKRQIKEKLESLLENINRSMTAGFEAAKIHQLVIDNLIVNAYSKAMLTAFIKATQEQIDKTEQQLAVMEFRASCGKEIIDALEDKDVINFVATLLYFIGVEQPVFEQEEM